LAAWLLFFGGACPGLALQALFSLHSNYHQLVTFVIKKFWSKKVFKKLTI
jgi:hypothetical protein